MTWKVLLLVAAIAAIPSNAIAQPLTMQCSDRREDPTGVLNYSGFFKANGIRATASEHSTAFMLRAKSLAPPASSAAASANLKFVYESSKMLKFIELQLPSRPRMNAVSPRMKLSNGAKILFDQALTDNQLYALRNGQSVNFEIPAVHNDIVQGSLIFTIAGKDGELSRASFNVDRKGQENFVAAFGAAAQARFLRQPMVAGKLPTSLPFGTNGCTAM